MSPRTCRVCGLQIVVASIDHSNPSWRHAQGGVFRMSCPDCGWEGAPYPEPSTCPRCGGNRIYEHHRAEPKPVLQVVA